jgi:hypothetical protein
MTAMAATKRDKYKALEVSLLLLEALLPPPTARGVGVESWV